ncbi:MAG: hypothetical protein BWY65_00371 [Firmicutes bacterium ADurb.Bin373]|nr:MAG: hypothetical protein BWY65_00371 [Firmicutes bacterium ADurb.Bin373]
MTTVPDNFSELCVKFKADYDGHQAGETIYASREYLESLPDGIIDFIPSIPTLTELGQAIEVKHLGRVSAAIYEAIQQCNL